MTHSVCVAGLGHIGLPTAAILADSGLSVRGFDIDCRRVAAVAEGRSPIELPELHSLVARAVRSGRLVAADAPAAADAFVIAVPTPLEHGNAPDTSSIRSVVARLAPLLAKGNLLVLESTSPVGTTEEICGWLAAARPDLSWPHASGEQSDIRVAYCPERTNSDSLLEELVNNDRLIGGITPACSAAAAALYRSFAKGACHITTARTAELAKLVENAYRDVNIAFANEVSLVCHNLGVDTWELLTLANQHPRVDILRPGPGVGGHCIPVDPWFIADSRQQLTPLIRAAREVNDAKQDWVAEQILGACEGIDSPVIACLGLAYKADIADLRESPAVGVVRQLQRSLGGRLLVVEPHLGTLPGELAGHAGTELSDLDAAVRAADIVALLTDHREFRSITRDQLMRKLVVDPRGFWAKTTRAPGADALEPETPATGTPATGTPETGAPEGSAAPPGQGEPPLHRRPRAMRIAFLTLNFHPEMGATATRLDALATGLADLGHEVRVVTAMPNYPSGRIADGYRWRLRSTEVREGVLVMRTAIFPSRSTRAFPRLLGQTSFAISCLLQVWRLGRQDVLVIESPPLLLVPAGLVLGRMSRAKVIMNVSDIWPDLPMRVGYRLSRLSLAVLRLLERCGYRRSDAVTTTTPGAAASIAERFEGVQTAVISNGVDLERFGPSRRSHQVRASLGAGPDDFLVGYCGLHGLFQGLELAVDAAVKLRDHPRIRFVLVGDGPTKEALVQLADDYQLSNIHFEDAVPFSEIPAILASCDAGLVPLATVLPQTIPSKIYEILASGIPAIVTAGSEGAALVERFGVGRTFPPQDRDALAAALEELADCDRSELGAACRETARRFDRKGVVLRADRIIRAVADGRPPSDAEG